MQKLYLEDMTPKQQNYEQVTSIQRRSPNIRKHNLNNRQGPGKQSHVETKTNPDSEQKKMKKNSTKNYMN